tara:strand:+ start:158 stop:445 length:288 start_codon:yes stop_codon:yes gene_type:complete
MLNTTSKYNTTNKTYSKNEKNSISPVIKISLFTTDNILMDQKMTDIKTIEVSGKNKETELNNNNNKQNEIKEVTNENGSSDSSGNSSENYSSDEH